MSVTVKVNVNEGHCSVNHNSKCHCWFASLLDGFTHGYIFNFLVLLQVSAL